MKKIAILGLFISLFTCCICVQAYDESFFCDFSSTKKIISKRILEDFGDNQFILYELDGGYAIYTIEESEEVFIEGSYKTNSIYNDIGNEFKLYYLGPGEYFYQKENMVYNIRTGDSCERAKLDATFKMNPISLESSIQMSRNLNYSSYVDENGFTVVKEDKYFRNLSYFPENWFGECGLITLSILLGYLDTFHNDNFIPNKFYDSRHYIDNKNVDADGDRVYDSVNIISEELARKVTYPYVDSDIYGLESWPNSAMPGTNFAMRDYLMDNYLHTFGIWEKPGIKDLKISRPSPMADEELKNTFKDYINANCSFLLDDITFHSGNLFFTHQHPKDYIKSGVPTVLVLADYSQQTRGALNTDWHDVVAYGYKDDKFLVHMGWWPGYKNYAEIVISSTIIYGYFAVEYKGEHNHSKNVLMEKNGEIFYICGCGYKHQHLYDTFSYLNENYHLSSCLCGKTQTEPHEWGYITGKAIPKPTAKYCKKCTIIVKL